MICVSSGKEDFETSIVEVSEISLSEEQPVNALSFIDVTEEGIEIFFKELQPLNVPIAIVFNEEGILTSSSDWQL